MSVLVVGGDRLGNITEKLSENGFSDIRHISGRKSGDRNIKISQHTDLVVILVDFVEHQLTEIIKKESKRQGIKVAFSKRSWIHMENKIQQCIKEISNVN